MAKPKVMSREAVKRRLRESRFENIQPSATDIEFAFKHMRELFDDSGFNRDGTRIDGSAQHPPRRESQLVDMGGNPYIPDGPLHPNDIWKRRGHDTLPPQQLPQQHHTTQTVLAATDQHLKVESDDIEEVAIDTQEEVSEPSSKRRRIEQSTDDNVAEITEVNVQHLPIKRTAGAYGSSISSPPNLQQSQDVAERSDTRVGDLRSGPDLEAIQRFSHNMTRAGFSRIDDSTSLPEAVLRLQRLTKAIGVLNDDANAEYRKLRDQPSAVNIYDKVQTANQKITAASGIYLQTLLSITSKDFQKDAPRDVAKWEVEIQRLLVTAGNGNVTSNNQQTLSIPVEDSDLRMQRFKEIRDTAAKLNRLLSGTEPLQHR